MCCGGCVCVRHISMLYFSKEGVHCVLLKSPKKLQGSQNGKYEFVVFELAQSRPMVDKHKGHITSFKSDNLIRRSEPRRSSCKLLLIVQDSVTP